MVDSKKIDWEALTFAHTPTKSMFVAKCAKGGQWQIEGLRPFGNLSISPVAGVLNYGQGLFEGMKAYATPDQRILLFRPTENAKRLAAGCERLCIPPIPEELFLDAVRTVVRDNVDYVPPFQPGAVSQPSLYIRPLVLGTGPVLGVAPAPEYTFIIYVTPVGPYFKTGFKPIRLRTNPDFHRAAPRGTGCVKAIGNYAASMYAGSLAKSEQYAEVLYLDACENRYVEEVGAANFFCLCQGRLLTPSLDGSILPGITRASIIQLAREKLQLPVEERRVAIEEVLTAEEAFGTGTAAVITPIGTLTHAGREYTFGDGQVGKITQQLYDLLTGILFGCSEDPYNWTEEVSRRNNA